MVTKVKERGQLDSVVLVLLFSLVSPLLLIPIEKILPWPHIIEEVVKLIIVLQILNAERAIGKKLWFWVFLAGVLFTFSESVLYLINIFALGDVSFFGKRLLITGPLHIGTFFVMYKLGKRGKSGIVLGLLLAIIIHYLFNLGITSTFD